MAAGLRGAGHDFGNIGALAVCLAAVPADHLDHVAGPHRHDGGGAVIQKDLHFTLTQMSWILTAFHWA